MQQSWQERLVAAGKRVMLGVSLVLMVGGSVQADVVPSSLYGLYQSLVRNSAQYYEIFEPDVFYMDTSDSETVTLTLDGGEYLFKATCDTDCDDVDLVIRDWNGRLVDSDFLDDSVPRVSGYFPQGRYTVKLNMESCDWDPCTAVLIYLKR
ncbi:hypothetical protein [Deinococcus puniceus]|uniref:Uncharacterized protein n=1 Tax=Deinococcus puniceus TaxID=1182568 RepID=A0A172TAU7_9DEIO|nr:hypothetical protein [Deinococcus puniceus]ANE44121.1 hypothetical protein SU48_10435 [Deinococcus puniceus]